MKTTASFEEKARTVLNVFKEKRIEPGGILHQSGLLCELRDMGFDLSDFRAVSEWLTSNGYLAIPAVRLALI